MVSVLEPNAMMDEEFRTWYHSFPQRVRRAMAVVVGGGAQIKVFNFPISFDISIGAWHNRPNVYVGLTAIKERRFWSLFSFVTTCTGTQVEMMGKPVMTVMRDCAHCTADDERAEAARQRVKDAIFNRFNTGFRPRTDDERGGRGPKTPVAPTPSGPSNGAALEWP